jgi:hypothetical protein
MYDFNCIIIDFVLVVQVFPICIACESFLVKLTFVEVDDKKESKLFSCLGVIIFMCHGLASCTN